MPSSVRCLPPSPRPVAFLGVVEFDASGDRAYLTANVQLSNIVVDASGNVSKALRAMYNRSLGGWGWEGGSREVRAAAPLIPLD